MGGPRLLSICSKSPSCTFSCAKKQTSLLLFLRATEMGQEPAVEQGEHKVTKGRDRFQSYSPTGPGVDQRDRGQREACTGRPLPCVSFGPRGIVLMVRLLPTLKYWEISLKDPGFRLLIKINRDDLAWHSHVGKCCLRFHLPVKSSTAAHFLAVQIQAPF